MSWFDIAKGVFKDCDRLTNITIPDSVRGISSSAFESCSSLTSVTIGDSVTSIGEYAFRYCSSLTSVTIGDSVESIGYMAFFSCNSLTSVYYTGSESEWQNIGIGNYNSMLPGAQIEYDNVPPIMLP